MGFQLAKLIFNKAETVLPALSEFSKAGNRVLSRVMMPAKSSLFHKLGAPLGTTSAEKLVVEKQFGKQSAEIITFKNANGNIIGRQRKDFTQGNFGTCWLTAAIKSLTMSIGGQKILNSTIKKI